MQRIFLARFRSERWVRSVKEECLSKLILFGERSFRRALQNYLAHDHEERNQQGKNNVLLFPEVLASRRADPVQCRNGSVGCYATIIARQHSPCREEVEESGRLGCTYSPA
jgi:hypothetical protein